MHPQTELENYKLQVELLQEKLHRSEDNRQELEGKLEQIMKKRNEHERTLRSTSQRKYQQFLDEQKKRNERNRKLVEMLERIDQQAAALSARSERLKMMKLQYELYFSKLVQSYSMQTLQGIPTATLLPIQRPPSIYTAIKTDDVVSTEVYQTSFQNTTPQFQTVPIPMMVPIPNDQNRFPRSWAFATAPPGVLLTLANNAALPPNNIGGQKKAESNFCFDYSQFPIGYLQTPTAVGSSHSYLQQPQTPSTERHSKPLSTPDDDIKQSRPYFEDRDQTDIKTNETALNRKQPELKTQIFDVPSDKPKRNDDLEIGNGYEPENFTKFQTPEMSNNDSSVPRQSLKVDKLPHINPNNSLQHRTEDGRTVHRGNKPNTIDFRTDDNDYIKYIKEMKETYDKNVPTPINVTPPTPQEHSVDNIPSTLQTQKIDEMNVKDDEKINYVEDNGKNTSSALPPPLGGKCSKESIGDEALTKKSLENKTVDENTSNTAARNIDLGRDTEQITLFNGTKNSKDESTGASNRTTAIIDGGGERSIENNENTRSETSYRPVHFDKKEKMSIENIESAIYGELLPKPESLPSAGLPVKEKGAGIEHLSPEAEQYGFNTSNSGKEFYEQERGETIMGDRQHEPHPTAIEQQNDENNGEVTEAHPQSYNYTDTDASAYDMQSYNYSDPTQDANQGEVVQQQQEYPYTTDDQQSENYATDYQNYDASQYAGDYDPNAYQYDYDQQQYGDPNQAQYPPEMYSQEYQQDPYSGEYANYEQNAPNEIDSSNHPYVEQQYAAPEEPEVPLEQLNTLEPDQTDTEGESETHIAQQNSSNVDEKTNEEVSPSKVGTPTSILSTEKHADLLTKKKKRVNFVDSETDESSTLPKPEAVSSESDFDFSAN